jgi:hypothetical protein
MGRAMTPLVLSLTATAALAAGQFPAVRTFDDKPGPLGGGFELTAMRQATPGTWTVRRAGTNGWVVHGADASASGYALALAPDPPLADVEMSVRLRLAGGARAGGLVWRYAGPDDYHAAVLDLGRRTLALFRVTGGNRVFLESEDDLELDADAWYVLKVVHGNGRIVVSLGGIRVLEERERRPGREGAGGRVGLIATGSSETWFDDLRVAQARERRP